MVANCTYLSMEFTPMSAEAAPSIPPSDVTSIVNTVSAIVITFLGICPRDFVGFLLRICLEEFEKQTVEAPVHVHVDGAAAGSRRAPGPGPGLHLGWGGVR